LRLTEQQVLALLDGRETVHLECKSAKGGLPSSVWETYSAFSNTDGGVILLGVLERNGKFSVSGVENVDSLQKNFWATLRNRSKVSLCTLQERDVYSLDIDGKKILVITVPRASRQIRPVYLDGNIFGSTFIRLHEGDFRCDDFAVKRMLADQSDTTDSELVVGTSLSDLNRPSLAGYRQLFRLMRPSHPYNELEDVDFLEKLNGYSRDYQTGAAGLTKAGLLMFGELSSILKHVPNYIVDYREYEVTDSPTGRWSDRVTTDFSWPGNLYRFCQTVIPKLYQRIKTPFKLEGWQRIDESPTHVAVREAVVNTIIHADYGERTAILIEQYPDRFVFRNPGLLRMPLNEVYSGGVSDCRNRALQKMFQMVGLSEQAGSGFPKIFHGWGEAQHFSRPQLRELPSIRTCELTFRLSATESVTTKEVVGSTRENDVTTREVADTTGGTTREAVDPTKESVAESETSTRQKIISLLQKNGCIVAEEMARRIGISVDGVWYHIKELRKKGIVSREGSTKSGRWVVKDIDA